MNRDDYRFRELSYENYETAVDHGTMPGYQSPMHGRANYDALIAVMREADIDPRLPLAFVWSEGHMMSDPGLVAARVNNPGGVKYVGAVGTTDSYIAADTGGTYAAYPDLSGYYRDWVRIMHNSIIGADFDAGNLIGVVEHYTNGPGTGHNKVDKFLEYQQAYPAIASGAPVSAAGVYGEDVIALAEQFIGLPYSDGTLDPWNPVGHPWSYWCEAFGEGVPAHLGLPVVHRQSAYQKGLAAQAQGLLHHDPLHGDQLFFDTSFYNDGKGDGGHTGFHNATRAQLIGTLTDGTGIGYRNWGPQTPGYMGAMTLPGVVGEHRGGVIPAPAPVDSHPVPEQNYVPVPNPYDHNAGVKGVEIGIGGGFLAKYRAIPDVATVLGWPIENERTASVDGKRMTIQRFERGTLLYAPLDPPPWDVVLALDTAVIVNL